MGGQPVGLGLQSPGEGGTLSWAGSHQQKCLSSDYPKQCRAIKQVAKALGSFLSFISCTPEWLELF